MRDKLTLLRDNGERIALALFYLVGLASAGLIIWFALTALLAGSFNDALVPNYLDDKYDYREPWVLLAGHIALWAVLLGGVAYLLGSTWRLFGAWREHIWLDPRRNNQYWVRGFVLFLGFWAVSCGLCVFMFLLSFGEFGGVR
jgi:hypothetical protein